MSRRSVVYSFDQLFQEELEKLRFDVPPCGYTPPTRLRKGYGEKEQAVWKRHLREMQE